MSDRYEWKKCPACNDSQGHLDGQCIECQRQKAHHLTWREIADAIYAMEAEGHEIDSRAFIDIDGNTQGFAIELTVDVYESSSPMVDGRCVVGEPHDPSRKIEYVTTTHVLTMTLECIQPELIRNENLPADPNEVEFVFAGVLA